MDKFESIMTRIQCDLKSNSASFKLRALNALKNPLKSEYSHFDVSLSEQSLYIHDELPTSMTDIMKGVVAYVDFRSGADNRTDGIKEVILSLGAKVMGRVTINTTHVIFKEGTLAAYKAAKRFNIPIVSILWVEACKKLRKICDPTEFPISDLDRFENPELYEKIKRVKSMQPGSEMHRRLGAATSTSRKNCEKNLKKTPSAISTPTPTKKQAGITQILSKFDNKPNRKNRTKIIAKDMDISTVQEENTFKHQNKTCTTKDLDISVASPNYTSRLTSIESEQIVATNIDLMTSTPAQDKNRESLESSQSDFIPQTSKTLVNEMLTPFASSTLIFRSSQSNCSSEKLFNNLNTTISDEFKTPVQEKFNSANGNLLIDEHANVFSSSHQPGNRLGINKTLMDIVSQHVQIINKSARRSLLPPKIHNELETHRTFLNSEMLLQCTPKESLTDTVKNIRSNCNSCDIPSEVYSTEQVQQEDIRATATPPVAIKKRKLFVPNESPLPQSNDIKHTSNIKRNKRQKTTLPTVQKQPSPSAPPPSPSPQPQPPRRPPIPVITPLTTFANNKMTDSKNKTTSADVKQDDIIQNKKSCRKLFKSTGDKGSRRKK